MHLFDVDCRLQLTRSFELALEPKDRKLQYDKDLNDLSLEIKLEYD